MSGASNAEILATLGRMRWAVLAVLAACAVFSWLHARETSALSPTLAASVTPIALALALAVVLMRRVALRAGSPRMRAGALRVTYLGCCALGVFGAYLALAGDDGQRGALFALGGGIFTLGSPPGFARLE